VSQRIEAGHTAFLYPYAGSLSVVAGDSAHPARPAGRRAVGRRTVELEAGPDGCGVLLITARPLGEPVVQYGPFVMNTREEIEQALDDYRAGTLA
jgi:redox-sensitive bicupin YhaK (pirin superfamily)